ncbi:TPA: hypothetical protein ACH3X2_008398 [Trebouxia sp. C0005]
MQPCRCILGLQSRTRRMSSCLSQHSPYACTSLLSQTTLTLTRPRMYVTGGRSGLRVVAGEGRSANRTRWSAKDMSAQQSNLIAPKTPSDEGYAAELVWQASQDLQPTFAGIDQLVGQNLRRVQAAMQRHRIGPHHFSGSTGYGHGDLGREAYDEVLADVLGAEAALGRVQFVSGTHAIATALYALLRPGDELLAVAGRPYDTMEEVIGLRGTQGHGSLLEWGVTYQELPLAEQGLIDWDALRTALTPQTKVALIQRSCGYASRPTLDLAEIDMAVQVIKSQQPDCLVVVDNCYGEFTDTKEPCAVGADLCMGSLIKNPGGTIVTGGGYVAGKAHLVRAAQARLTAPGVGMDAGCVPGDTVRLMMQGLFLAPQMVGEALKGGRLLAQVMSQAGYPCTPMQGLPTPHSFITAVHLGSSAKMTAFCRAVQRCCPIGSYIQPIPGITPGYKDEVIFADGTFIDGSTSELSADGPIRPPYTVYCQGGTHWTHWAFALESALEAIQTVHD